MKTIKLFTMMAVLGAAMLPLTGCGNDSPTDPVAGAELYDVTVTLNDFHVVGDCDELLGGKGEFSYKAKVRASGGDWDQLVSKSLKGDKGKSYSIDEKKDLTLDGKNPKSIEVYFWAKEMDSQLFGDDKPDERMNSIDKIAVHAYHGNGDWDLGSHSITLGDDNGCKVRLDYTVQSVKVD